MGAVYSSGGQCVWTLVMYCFISYSGDASAVTISAANAPDYDVTYTAVGVYELTCSANSETASQSVTVELGTVLFFQCHRLITYSQILDT